MSSSHELFLNMIKNHTIDSSYKNNICPSIIAAVAIIKSSWNTDAISVLSFNLYKTPINKKWCGRCISKDTETIYDSVKDCKEIGPILYKVFDSYNDSIDEFIDYIVTKRRLDNDSSPLKYQSIFGDYEYKSVVDKLVRAGFMKDIFRSIDDVVKISNIINIIENNKLYEWDNEIKEINMSKKRNRISVTNNIQQNTDIVEEIVINDMEAEDSIEENDSIETIDAVGSYEIPHMYRVRLYWEMPNTQIFASPNYKDAKEEALKHEGYKIYIDDDGELFEDPWEKVDPEDEDDMIDSISGYVYPQPGKMITLKNRPVYTTAIASKPFAYVSGTFYFYDHVIVNRRVKITKIANIKTIANKNPSMIFGYVNVK